MRTVHWRRGCMRGGAPSWRGAARTPAYLHCARTRTDSYQCACAVLHVSPGQGCGAKRCRCCKADGDGIDEAVRLMLLIHVIWSHVLHVWVLKLRQPTCTRHVLSSWRLGSKKGRGRTGGNRKFCFERDVLLSGLFEVEVARPRLLNPFWDSEVEG